MCENKDLTPEEKTKLTIPTNPAEVKKLPIPTDLAASVGINLFSYLDETE